MIQPELIFISDSVRRLRNQIICRCLAEDNFRTREEIFTALQSCIMPNRLKTEVEAWEKEAGIEPILAAMQRGGL